MSALPSSLIEPIWDQFCALLPPREVRRPLGWHRPRIADRVVFDKLVQVLIFGCAYWRSAGATCSATTLRRRRDEWIAAGVMERLQGIVLAAYDRMIGLELADLAVGDCISKAPGGGELAGRSPVDRGKQGLKRSTVVDGNGIPLEVIAAPANRHDAPRLGPTLDTLELGGAGAECPTVHLDRGYDSGVTRATLAARGLRPEIAVKGKPAPVTAGKRWVVERTNAWTNAHKKLVWCPERPGAVIAFWLAFATVVIVVRRLIRLGRTHYRWDTRPPRRPWPSAKEREQITAYTRRMSQLVEQSSLFLETCPDPQ